MIGLLRYQIFTVYGIILLAIWYGALQQQQQKREQLVTENEAENTHSSAYIDILILYLPLWVIFALGIYALCSVIFGVLMLKDYPDAAAEIDQQIAEAKTEMKKRGIIKGDWWKI